MAFLTLWRFCFNQIHNLSTLAKLNIFGNPVAILPLKIANGVDIIDIDHLVPSMSDFATLLGPYQVFSGKADPVTIIHDGTPEIIKQSVIDELKHTAGWFIISAGCKITPGTSVEKILIYKSTKETLLSSFL